MTMGKKVVSKIKNRWVEVVDDDDDDDCDEYRDDDIVGIC